MSTVIIQPLTLDSPVEADTELVQLKILTKYEDWEGLFDQIEVWRSVAPPNGPYEELTGRGWNGARVPRGADDAGAPGAGASVYIAGLGLNVLVDGTDEFFITFVGPDPITLADAATQIDTQAGGRFTAYLTDLGELVLQGTRPGTGALLEVTGGDAAAVLQLPIDPPESQGRGTDARLALIKGKESYDFTDLLGSKKYFYRTRFRNSSNNSVSEFSTPFSVGRNALGLSPGKVACGYLDLIGSDGRPLVNQLVQMFAPTQSKLVEDKLVTGPRQAQRTDENGHVEFTLVRDVEYTVSITGTDIVREIRVPADESVKIFNLLGHDEALQSDAFKVQVPDYTYAERRTL